MAINSEDTREVVLIDVDLIAENPFQPRKDFNEEELSELADSIKTHGLIQPVIVRKLGERYQVVAGERRLRSFRKLQQQNIPAIVIDIDGTDVAELSIIENVQRKNLNCIEEAMAFNIMKLKFGMTAEDIAKRIGKSRPYVSNIMRLLILPDPIKEALFNNKISMGHGRALLSIEEHDKQEEAFNLVVRNSLSVRQTEELVSRFTSMPREKKDRRKKIYEPELFDDARNYYADIKSIVTDFRKQGGKADFIERETEDYMELIVRIMK